jgi:Fe-S-cluster containining protein
MVDVNGVKFHIPKLNTDNLFVLWRCLWPDCHNCCDRPTVLPLTKDDIEIMYKKMGYNSKIDFIKKETIISSWTQRDYYQDQVSSTHTHISLKRKQNETQKDEGKSIRCRFVDNNGCRIHSYKPGACWMYPFVSYLENDSFGNRSIVHALFQFTGDCHGFYVDK